MSQPKAYHVSGHLDLTGEEFANHYIPKLKAAMAENAIFLVGDARGTDSMVQAFLKNNSYPHVLVYHMYETPRNNVGHKTIGGFTSDEERDAAMTNDSQEDIAWVRPGREKSGTAKNIARRASRAKASC